MRWLECSSNVKCQHLAGSLHLASCCDDSVQRPHAKSKFQILKRVSALDQSSFRSNKMQHEDIQQLAACTTAGRWAPLVSRLNIQSPKKTRGFPCLQ
jgi:hypothetical protein